MATTTVPLHSLLLEADVQAAQQYATVPLGVPNARLLDVIEPFVTVGKAAQLLGAALPPHIVQHQQAGAAEHLLTVCRLITAEAPLKVLRPQQAAAAGQSFVPKVALHYAIGRTLALGQVQAATMTALFSSQLHHGVCLSQAEVQ